MVQHAANTQRPRTTPAAGSAACDVALLATVCDGLAGRRLQIVRAVVLIDCSFRDLSNR
jgi:hypothetical protein